jgi:hypothetical protein
MIVRHVLVRCDQTVDAREVSAEAILDVVA